MGRLFQGFPISTWSEWSAVVFLIFFMVILFWAYSPRRKKDFERYSRMALSTDPDAGSSKKPGCCGNCQSCDETENTVSLNKRK